jgi:hypothetical protein
MRPPNMSGHFLLAPIPESSSDYLLPKDIKLAVLGAGRVGKSGECGGDPRVGFPCRAAQQQPGTLGKRAPGKRQEGRSRRFECPPLVPAPSPPPASPGIYS